MNEPTTDDAYRLMDLLMAFCMVLVAFLWLAAGLTGAVLGQVEDGA